MLRDQPLPRVNVLVDLYNAVSVRRIVPVGGEDADRLEGDLRLTITAGGEVFDPRDDGSDLEELDVSEIVWRDERAVTCRRWDWRQSRRTQLTEATTNAYFIFDRLDGLAVDELQAAVDDLERALLDRWPDCHLDRLERRAP